MTRHTCAVILLGGWLLMMPPYTHRGGKIVLDIDAPIATWSQDSAHDSAEACEHSRVEAYSGFQEKRENDRAERYMQARCVPAEYVYAPKKPAQK